MEQTMQPVATTAAADALADMADTLRALRILYRGARRRAQQAARGGQRQVAERFTSHARQLAHAARMMQRELRRALALAVVQRAAAADVERRA